MKPISDTLGVARSNLVEQAAGATRQRRGRRPQPEAALLAEIKALIAGQPTYGYRASMPCSADSGASKAARRST